MSFSETLEQDAPLVERRAWFFDLYAALLGDPAAARPGIEARIVAADIDDANEAALALFLAGQYVDLTGDAALFGTPRLSALADRVAARLQRELQSSINTFTDTWAVALWAAALRAINEELRRSDLTQLVGRVKNHVYAHHVRSGTLMSSSDKATLGYDLLLAAVPFGLFDPEDLALVDAVRTLAAPERLAGASASARMLLAWYFGEQGSYARSRMLLAGGDGGALTQIVARRLKVLGQLGERFIRHQPDGNGNRYEPLVEERFPKLVSEDDEVIVRALASPLSIDEPLELVMGGAIIAGTFKGNCWEFLLPKRPAGSVCAYAIRFRRHLGEQTATFHYEVLSRRDLGDGLGLSSGDGRIVYQAANGTLSLAPGKNGALRVELLPASGTDLEVRPVSEWQADDIGDFSCILTVSPPTLAIDRNGTPLVVVTGASWLESLDGKVHEISLALRHRPCGYFGLGERCNALDQRGNSVDQFVYNQYKDQGLRTYIPMPVFYTDRGFGLHIDTTSYSSFDFARPGDTRLFAEGANLALDLFAGSINDQIAQFIAATGEPEPVPDWALGPWMSSNNWDSEAEVRKQIALTQEHGIPATVLVIEAWSDEATFYIFNDATYGERPGADPFAYSDFDFPVGGRWPNPKGLVEHLHDNGLKLILWQIPVIKQTASLRHAQKRRDEQHFIERGFGVRRPDGTPLRLPEGWFRDSLLMDFTNPEGVEWWFSKRQYLIDELGVDGFKTDGGEMVWGRDLVFADGTTGLANRNKYPRDYISAYYRFAQQNGGICFSRAGYTGAQTFPAHWAGDERSTWDAFRRSILAGLSSGMSGIIFWGFDLGGFSGEVPSAELYIRSAQMACFCPIMQYHAESKAEFNQDRTPWNIAERSGDERARTGYAFHANLRISLLPYLVREAAHCVAAKTPLMRAMLLDHEGDAAAVPLWDQYRFGRDLLVAPVIREGERSRSVYLPAGHWWHLFQNRWFEGSQIHAVDAPLEQIPVFVREGALLPLAFDNEARLGATMPSGVNRPRHLVLLLVSAAGISTSYETPTGTIFVECDADGTVRVVLQGPIGMHCTLVFADAPPAIIVDGSARQVGTLALSGVPLAAATLSE